MTWLTWRQFRIPALSVFAALAAIGVVLVISGMEMRGETNFSDQEFMYSVTLLVMYALPAVLGVFWGVPMVTRELEAGTHSLVWNQTVTRKQWLTTKLVVGVLTAMVAAGLLSLAVTWWTSPIDALADADPQATTTARMSPVVFDARGIAPIGYAAFAFVLGIAFGIALRRTVTAMAITLVAFVAVMVAVPFLVRPYILPPSEETVTVTDSNIWQIRGNENMDLDEIAVMEPAGSWALTNETVDRAGNTVSPLPASLHPCLPPLPGREAGVAAAPLDRLPDECIAQGFADLGYKQRLVYQPASHFWPLQWIELAFFLALSALVTWFCFRRIRHVS
ncbi:transporter [Actinophytocola sp.]|uniref:transporter n=1 Tax=Actinophytocola sp. TaxID=1872138 RepID=UPI002ED09DC6